jgi:hypothetical protein
MERYRSQDNRRYPKPVLDALGKTKAAGKDPERGHQRPW